MVGTPNIDAFRAEVERMQSQATVSGPMRAQYQALDREITAQTSGLNGLANGLAIIAFERNLGSSGFKKDLLSLADNPDVLRRILPQMIAQPDSMVQIVDRAAAAAQPAQRPAAPQRSAATTNAAAASETRRPVAPEAPAQPRRAVQSQASPVAAAAAASEPNASPQQSAAPATAAAGGLSKLEQLINVDREGYAGLMKRVSANPRLSDMFEAMMNGSGDPAAADEGLDSILEQAKRNPNIFKDLSKTIDEHPGVVSSIAENMANNPRAGLMALGAYSQLQQGGGMAVFSKLIGPGVFDGMISGLMDMIGKLFSGSGSFMGMGNANLLEQFGKLTNSNAQVTRIDPETGVASDPARLGTETPAQLAQQREERLRREGQLQQPQQSPGGMSAPAPSGA